MNGVTTALVAFVFVGMIFPSIIRNRSQFYAALGIIFAIILLDGIAHVVGTEVVRTDAAGKVLGVGPTGFYSFSYIMVAVLQVVAIFVLFLSAGGLSPRELAKDIQRAYEVIRRGESEKEIIIPITGERPAQKQRPAGEPAVPVSEADTPAGKAQAPSGSADPAAAAAAKAQSSAIPPRPAGPAPSTPGPIPLE